MKRILIFLLPVFLFFLIGCTGKPAEAPADLCRIVIEEGEGFSSDCYAFSVRRGESLTLNLTEEEGYRISGSDYGNELLERTADGVILTLRDVRYTKAVRIVVRKSDVTITYHSGDETVILPVTPSHLRLNTATDLFSREGYTLTGWNTMRDGSGETIPLGSRTEPGSTLYAEWSKWSDESLFSFEDGTVIAYLGSEKTVTVPAEIGGEPVRTVASGAFAYCHADTVILPQSIRTVESGAFRGAKLHTLFLFDSVQKISDYSFEGCDSLETLHLNAALPPVYSTSYYATFADKFDRLLALRHSRKIVLFSGSSARFGYDSAMMDEAFPDYEVVNMGVFAYSNALPQLELIRTCMKDEDILLLSPELDAAKRQFCTVSSLDAPFFNMLEADYGMISRLDLRQYDLVFSSLSEYLSGRQGMEDKRYSFSPSSYDEDGNPVSVPSYNAYGDYILYRPNSPSDEPFYGLKVPYTADYYRKELYVDPFNAEMQRFLDMGVNVYMTYSPRNRLALSEDSTEEEILALDAYFRDNLSIPVISDIRDSLVSGEFLYGTDNHLSTEGVKMRTECVIKDLQEQLREEGENA